MSEATPAQARLASLYMELLGLSGSDTGLVVGPVEYDTPDDVEEGAPETISVSFSYSGQPGRVQFTLDADDSEATVTVYPGPNPGKWIRTEMPVSVSDGYSYADSSRNDAKSLAGIIGEWITSRLNQMPDAEETTDL